MREEKKVKGITIQTVTISTAVAADLNDQGFCTGVPKPRHIDIGEQVLVVSQSFTEPVIGQFKWLVGRWYLYIN
jgi:hypothetical protein